MTPSTKTIPVPVEVLRRLLVTSHRWAFDRSHCGVCCIGDDDEGNVVHDPTCPIPALREAVEESEKTK